MADELASISVRVAQLEQRAAEDRKTVRTMIDELRAEIRTDCVTPLTLERELAHAGRAAARQAASETDARSRRRRELVLVPIGLLTALSTVLSILAQIGVLNK